MDETEIPEHWKALLANERHAQAMHGAIMGALVSAGVLTLEQLSEAILAQAVLQDGEVAERLRETARMLFSQPPTLTVIEGGLELSSEPDPQQ